MGPKLYKLEVVTCTLIGNDDVVSILAGKNKWSKLSEYVIDDKAVSMTASSWSKIVEIHRRSKMACIEPLYVIVAQNFNALFY